MMGLPYQNEEQKSKCERSLEWSIHDLQNGAFSVVSHQLIVMAQLPASAVVIIHINTYRVKFNALNEYSLCLFQQFLP